MSILKSAQMITAARFMDMGSHFLFMWAVNRNYNDIDTSLIFFYAALAAFFVVFIDFELLQSATKIESRPPKRKDDLKFAVKNIQLLLFTIFLSIYLCISCYYSQWYHCVFGLTILARPIIYNLPFAILNDSVKNFFTLIVLDRMVFLLLVIWGYLWYNEKIYEGIMWYAIFPVIFLIIRYYELIISFEKTSIYLKSLLAEASGLMLINTVLQYPRIMKLLIFSFVPPGIYNSIELCERIINGFRIVLNSVSQSAIRASARDHYDKLLVLKYACVLGLTLGLFGMLVFHATMIDRVIQLQNASRFIGLLLVLTGLSIVNVYMKRHIVYFRVTKRILFYIAIAMVFVSFFCLFISSRVLGTEMAISYFYALISGQIVEFIWLLTLVLRVIRKE